MRTLDLKFQEMKTALPVDERDVETERGRGN